MAREKEVLGYIDCPACGTKDGMRITHDKNGEPFGFCESNCDQQLRVGGSRRRVAAFLARFPWAAGKAAAPVVEVTVTGTDKELREGTAKATIAKPAPVPVPVPAKPAPESKPAPAKKPFSFGL